MFKRFSLCALAVCSLVGQETPAAPKQRPPRPPRPGVKTPGVQRPMANIKPIAEFPVPGVPDWQVVTDDSVWVSNGPKNSLHRLDVKTNKVVANIEVGKRPCSGLAAGFGSIWVPNCVDKTVSRVDIKTNKVIATIPVGPAESEGGIAASKDAIWLPSDKKGVLSKIDPKTNTISATIDIPEGSPACTFGEGAVWCTSTEKSLVVRVDPKTNQVTDKIEVGPRPRFLTTGGGSVWTLNQGDGTVSRVDAKKRTLIKHIELGIPGSGGEIAWGEGGVWVTVFQIPLTFINGKTNAVVKQWTGPGGDAVRVGHGSVWLSNLREQNLWRIDPRSE